MIHTRTTVLALAAVVAVGAAFVTSSAEARGFGGGFSRGGGSFGRHVSFARPIGGATFHRANLVRPINWNRFHHRPYWHHHHHRHFGWYRPYVYGVSTAAVAAPAYAAAPMAPSAKPCTCLTKEYTADKLVVFKDLCTREIAASPIGGMPQAGAPQPGEVDPQDGADTK
jgi:hypothetical protein